MKILTRYVIREMLGPTALGFVFYTSIILVRQLFDWAGMIIKGLLTLPTFGRLLLLSIPNIVVLTVPMSLLFGILIAVGRLSADSEIIAMRALGISTRTIYRPVFIFSVTMFLLNLYLMNDVLPKGNSMLQKVKAEVATSGAQKEIRPRLFYGEFPNVTVYVNDVDPRTSEWRGVFVADTRTEERDDEATRRLVQTNGTSTPSLGQGPKISIARTGNLSVVKRMQQIWLNLHNSETHVWDPRKPDRYDVNRNLTQRILLGDRFSMDPNRFPRSLREMTLSELWEQQRILRHSTDTESYNSAWVEINKKLSIPFACIAFGVLGLPLGLTNRRGGKSSGFSLSIVIILVYYVFINNGEALAAAGRISPAIAMWTPNLVLLAIGVYLLRRANRDTGAQRRERGLIARLLRSVTGFFTGRRRTMGAEEEMPSILSRLDITFPNIVDRYVLREFSRVLGLVILSTTAMFIIVDYTGLANSIRSNHIPAHVVIAYYRFYFFQVLNWTLPISVLVATLVTFGMLSKNNEVTALKSGGISLYRVALPVVAVAILISVLAYLLLDFVLPYSNQRVESISNRIKKGKEAAVAAANQQRLWLVGKGRYFINFLTYDRTMKELTQVQVFELHPTEFRLTRRVFAQRARWNGRSWVFENGWMRSFLDNGTWTESPITTPLALYYRETPEDFETEVRTPEEMTFAQLRRYIATIRHAGYSAETLDVKLYVKTSWPALSLVMALIALPFAFKIGKRGALYGIGIALVLGIFYWIVFVVFTKFGEVGNLPAVLSAWSANILFSIAAVYMFLHVET